MFMDDDQVTYADICYEAASVIASSSAEEMHRERKVSDDRVIGTLLDEMALQLSVLLDKYVPEDEQDKYIEPLLKYEEYINE